MLYYPRAQVSSKFFFVIERTRDLLYLKFVGSPEIVLAKTLVTQRSHSAVSAWLVNPLPDRYNYSPLCHTHYTYPNQEYFIVSSGQTLYQAASWRLIFTVQCFTAESSQELSALRKLNNKRQVSMFLLKFLIQLPFCLFSLYLYPLSTPFLNPLSSPSPQSLLSLLINSLSS